MFGWEFPPFNSGGLGVACFGLTRALQRIGVDVSFVLPKKINSSKKQEVCRMVFADTEIAGGTMFLSYVDSPLTPYMTTTEYHTHLSSLPHNQIPVYGKSLIAEVMRYGARAGAIAQRELHDVIHAHDWLSFPAGMAAKAISGKPLIVHIHATEFDRTGGQGVNQHVYDIERAGFHAADQIIAVSHLTRSMVIEKYAVPPHKVSVVHNGIDPEDHTRTATDIVDSLMRLKREGAKFVLYHGRITIQKGPDYFVRLAEQVRQLRPNTYFLVSGHGDMERQMMQDVAYRGLSSQFIFLGSLWGEAAAAIFKVADLCVMPSVSEPFGIVPLESLMYKTPVLVSKQSGVSEVLSHVLKVDFWDIDEMTNKVIAVIDHGALYETLRDSGHQEALHLSWKKAARKIVDVYTGINAQLRSTFAQVY